MANAKDLELTIGEWYKSVPHLPKNGQKWLAENVWWLALIGAVLSVLGLLAVIPLFLAAIAVSTVVTTATLGYAPVYTATSGIFWLSALISIASYIVTTVLLIMAISPLKAGKKKGWTFLFWSYLLNFVFAVVSNLVSINIFGIVSAAIGAAVAGYFLYEIHGYFVTKTKVVHHEKVTAK